MNNAAKEILKGFALAIVVTLLGTALFVLVLMPSGALEEVFEKLCERDLLTKVIALGALPNVLLFHRLLNRNKLYKARGILLAMVLIALIFVYLKFT